jgi:hypothetical protein
MDDALKEKIAGYSQGENYRQDRGKYIEDISQYQIAY